MTLLEEVLVFLPAAAPMPDAVTEAAFFAKIAEGTVRLYKEWSGWSCVIYAVSLQGNAHGAATAWAAFSTVRTQLLEDLRKYETARHALERVRLPMTREEQLADYIERANEEQH